MFLEALWKARRERYHAAIPRPKIHGPPKPKRKKLLGFEELKAGKKSKPL